MACGRNLQLQLRFFDALVASSAMFGGELWGLRRGLLVEHNKTAGRFVKHLKQLAGLPASTHTESFLLELGRLSLPARWLQCGVRFWNQLLALPVTICIGMCCSTAPQTDSDLLIICNERAVLTVTL